MNGINLIPAPRRAAKRRRAHVRYCAAGCIAWAVLSAGVACGARAVWREDDPQAADRLAKVNEETQRTEKMIATVRAQLATAQSALRANQSIAAQPDWSILLALLGQQVGNDVVLKSCKVRPGVGRPVASPPRPDPRRIAARPQSDPAAAPQSGEVPFLVEASGMAVDHAAASGFVLRLERTGLFSRVTLLDTAREPFFDRNAIGFRLECSVSQLGPQDTASAAGSSAPAPGAAKTRASEAPTARGGE